MRQIIYIDVVFIENLVINYLLIYVVDRFCRCSARFYRIALAAVLGSFYVLMVFIDCGAFVSAVSKILVSALMILTAFGYGDLRKFIRRIVLFYISSFVLCGAILAMFYISNTSIESVNGTLVIQDIKGWHILVGGILANIMTKLAFDYLDNHYAKQGKKVVLLLKLLDKSIPVNALLDSGNSLCDPITGRRVIVVSAKAAMEIIPEAYHKQLRCILASSKQEVDYELIYNLNNIAADDRDHERKLCFRLIPYKALGVENGRLLGLSLDAIQIMDNDGTRMINKPVIALYDKPISEDNHFDAIAYSEIIKEGL